MSQSPAVRGNLNVVIELLVSRIIFFYRIFLSCFPDTEPEFFCYCDHSIFLKRDFYQAILFAIIENFPFHQLQIGLIATQYAQAVKFIKIS